MKKSQPMDVTYHTANGVLTVDTDDHPKLPVRINYDDFCFSYSFDDWDRMVAFVADCRSKLKV